MNVREEMWGMKPAEAEQRKVRRRAGGKPLKVRLPPRGAQLSFADKKTWGGPRPGSGRKASLRANVRHRPRPKHSAYCPVHVTLRRAKGLPNFRTDLLHRLLCQAIKDTRRDGFRIVHYSVQADHVHLIVEAVDAPTLTNGMRSFAVRIAMRVNKRVMQRPRGRVWGDRHHRRELTSPSEVRSALVYVLNNHMKHGEWEAGLVDSCSSAPWFDGWMHRRDPKPPDPPPTEHASTWLLDEGWTTAGIGWLVAGEVPRAVRA
jgi:REP element-mobilizing transposase RayT